MKTRWRSGNQVELLENGEQYFPRVLDAIDNATQEVLFETFILEDDDVGRAIRGALIAAARRRVRVEITLDAWGSMRLPRTFIDTLTAEGVCVHLFDLVPAWRLRIAWFRRLHRKLMAVDGLRALVGGINVSEDQLANRGPRNKRDYAVDIRGPVVADIRDEMADTMRSVHRSPTSRAADPPPPPAGDMMAAFVARDNGRHRTLIERHYRHAIAQARRRVLIANAYFFPGYRFLLELRRAARRGVDVRLLLQGNPDTPVARLGARLLYAQLLQAGIRVYEYRRQPFHGKVAVVDDAWATVGSSNLDPLSLALNLEANVVVRDRGFATGVRQRLERLMAHDCTEVADAPSSPHPAWRPVTSTITYHVLRHFPQWSGWLPAHTPSLTVVGPTIDDRRPDRAPEQPDAVDR